MISISAAFGDQVKLPTGGVAILGTELVGLKRELLNGVENNGRVRTGNPQIVVVNAIHGKVIVSRASTTYCTSFADRSTRLRDRVRRQNRQVQDAVHCSTNHRHILHLVRVEVVIERGRCGFDLRRGCRHFHNFRGRSQRKMRVGYVVLIH